MNEKIWQLVSDENKISTYESKDLRSIYRPVKINGECQIRYN